MTIKEKVLSSYESHDSNEISTERLLQMVADDCECSVLEVVDILYEHSKEESEGEN